MSDNGDMSDAALAEHPRLRSDVDPDPIAALDPLVVNPGRLSILLTLAGGEAGVEFVDLRRRTRLTDGNLACHARRLAGGGLIGIDKQFRAGKPVTTYLLTDTGRQALQTHIDGLVSAVGVVPTVLSAIGVTEPLEGVAPPTVHAAADPVEDDWID